MSKIIIRKEEDCPIKPMDIDINNHFWGAFGNSETEVSANYIVRLCRVKGGWYPFTLNEIEEFYQSFGYKNFWFNRLLEENFIIQENGKYCITIEFVGKCYTSSPRKSKS